jgi:hypothetical protein
MTKKESKEKPGILFTQGGGKKEQPDPHLILVLKSLREKLDEWLKSINDRIESEEITRLEVRFLEVLRSILEWVREKVDAKIESSEKEKPQKKERGLFRETHQRVFPLLPPLLLPSSPSLEMTNGLYAHKGWIAQIEI